MTIYFASEQVNRDNAIMTRVDLTSEALMIVEGGERVVWNLPAPSISYTNAVYVGNYDSSRHGEYTEYGSIDKPHIVFRAAQDYSRASMYIKDADGNILYTISTDCSQTPIYIVLKLSVSEPFSTWVLA